MQAPLLGEVFCPVGLSWMELKHKAVLGWNPLACVAQTPPEAAQSVMQVAWRTEITLRGNMSDLYLMGLCEHLEAGPKSGTALEGCGRHLDAIQGYRQL